MLAPIQPSPTIPSCVGECVGFFAVLGGVSGRDGKSSNPFPLTARRIDMGNTMRIDMGNTFCALRRPATHFLREAELLHTSSQTPSIGPLGACDEVCSSSCGTGEISLQTIEVLPMCVLKVLPMSMRATLLGPLPARSSQGEDGGLDRALDSRSRIRSSVAKARLPL